MNKIKKGTAKTARNWKNIEKKYFAIADKIFNHHPWPKGKYIAYASIFGMFPRNIQSKYFYFPPIHPIFKFANKVTAHEMLHFIFFDYVEKHYGLKEDSAIKGKPDNYLWQVSEVFSNVMENWRPYQKIAGDKGRPYKGTEKIFNEMTAQWQKRQGIAWLLDQWLKNISAKRR